MSNVIWWEQGLFWTYSIHKSAWISILLWNNSQDDVNIEHSIKGMIFNNTKVKTRLVVTPLCSKINGGSPTTQPQIHCQHTTNGIPPPTILYQHTTTHMNTPTPSHCHQHHHNHTATTTNKPQSYYHHTSNTATVQKHHHHCTTTVTKTLHHHNNTTTRTPLPQKQNYHHNTNVTTTTATLPQCHCQKNNH